MGQELGLVCLVPMTNRLDTVNNEMSQQSTIYLHNVLRVNRTKANIMKIRFIIVTHLTVCICELCLKLLSFFRVILNHIVSDIFGFSFLLLDLCVGFVSFNLMDYFFFRIEAFVICIELSFIFRSITLKIFIDISNHQVRSIFIINFFLVKFLMGKICYILIQLMMTKIFP